LASSLCVEVADEELMHVPTPDACNVITNRTKFETLRDIVFRKSHLKIDPTQVSIICDPGTMLPVIAPCLVVVQMKKDYRPGGIERGLYTGRRIELAYLASILHF